MLRSTVNREHLITLLEFVQPGLSQREIIEQSSCFVFKNGLILTFNDEIACSVDSPFKFEGAVQAAPLLDLLHRMKENEIDIKTRKTELRVFGKRRQAGIRMEAEVTLPVDKVERPKKWTELPDSFSEAVKLACQCVGKDESKFMTTCVHIHPKWIEASDSYQIARYRLQTGMKQSIMVRGQSIKQVADVGATHFCETDNWIHFRNESDISLIMSCRRHLDEYLDLTPHLKVSDAEPLVLPKGLAEACEKAGIFSSESTEDNLVSIVLSKGKLVVKGEGVLGWYKETKKVSYNGRPLSFMVSPAILAEIVQRMNECEITEEKLKVKGDKWTYVSCLSQEKDTDDEKDEDEDSEEESGD